jgi:hypothetical protein
VHRTPTVRQLAEWLERQPSAAPAADGPLAPGQVPLNPLQTDMLVQHLFYPEDLSQHCAMGWHVDGPLDLDALRHAVARVHRRHEALRASFRMEDEPIAEAFDTEPPGVTALAAATRAEAEDLLRSVLSDPLYLEKGEIWRVVTVAVDGAHLVGVAAHHIAFDGWSEAIMAGELSAGYNAFLAGSAAPEDPAPTLAQIATASRSHVPAAELEAQREHWRAELRDIPALRYGGAGGDLAPGEPRVREYPLAPGTLDGVGRRAEAHGVTPYTVLLALYGRALADVSGQRDIGVGTPIARRGDRLLDGAITCLIDIVCLRLRLAGADDELADLTTVAGTVRAAFAAQDIPINEVVRIVNPPRDDRSPLFQTMFALQNTEPAPLDLAGTRSGFYRPAPFDLPTELLAEVWPFRPDGPHLVVSHQPGRVPAAFADAVAARMLARLANL